MSRTSISVFPAITVEGSILPAATIDAIARRDAGDQTEADYGIRQGLSIRDEISLAFRVAQAHVTKFEGQTDPGLSTTARFVQGLLTEAFGFDDLESADHPVAFAAGEGRVPVVVVPPSDSLDRASEALSTDRRRSAAFALQDHLNEREEALWGLAVNGTTIRLMRDNASLTRPAWLEADLSQMVDTEDIASFSLLWLLIHRTRFGHAETPATDCALERWRDAGAREGEAARDKLADQVEQALRTLGTGFLGANPALRKRLTSGDLPLTDWFNELLRLVYRLIFLMVAEDRQLLHPADAATEARELYAGGYALSHLRELAIRRAAWDRHHDRYEGVKVVFRALADGEPELSLPALGGLFATNQFPTLEVAQLPNRALLEAIYRLGWLRDKDALVPVNWRAMETEELGSVYESLLELQPQLTDDGRTLMFAQDTAETKGNQRKTTGSYYTPDSLVQALLDSALDPVLDRTEAEAEDPAEAFLSLTVIDPACGSGHFLLAAARRIATRVARYRAEGTPSATDFRHALRDVAGYCLHGVDRNPMAVELTKVALWIETVDPGLPLGFFEAQIRCGDALLGMFDRHVLYEGIPDNAYKPLAGDIQDAAKYYQKVNRDAKAGQGTLGLEGEDLSKLPTARPFTRAAEEVRSLPEKTVTQIEEKRRRFNELRQTETFQMVEMACDTYVAAFLFPKTHVPSSSSAQCVPTTEDVWQALQGDTFSGTDGYADAARTAHAFHWPLEFPDIMVRGGFDVAIGNPPWDVLQLSDKEYFATRNPEIAELAGAARKRAIEKLKADDPPVYAAFVKDKRRFEATNEFVRASGRFDLTARGKVNSYALFAELFASLTRTKGRAGVIVPTGIATDANTAPFFSNLVAERRLSTLVDFENRQGLFPAVDSRLKFCLLTLGHNEPEARFAFFLHHTSQLAEPERNFTLTPQQIETINPNTRTAPVFRSRADAELTAKIYANVPVLVEEGRGRAGNPWGVEFRQGLFNMTSDSGLFRTAAQLEDAGFVRDGPDWVSASVSYDHKEVAEDRPGKFGIADSGQSDESRCVPLYEAKMIHQFDHRWAGYGADGVSPADSRLEQKRDPEYEPHPRYWVPKQTVNKRLHSRGWTHDWLLGWRDITNATNERTVIATIFPKLGVGNNLPLMLFPKGSTPEQIAVLPACLSSLALDFVARHKVGGTHLNFFIYQQLPILVPDFYTPERNAFVIGRVLELTYTSHSLAFFARDLGYDGPPFPWDEDRRAHLRAELDAFYARAYGLTRDELRFILDPADIKGPEYPSETFRVLKNNEIREYGEYRTARLVLAAWDRFVDDGTFADLDLAP